MNNGYYVNKDNNQIMNDDEDDNNNDVDADADDLYDAILMTLKDL